MDYIKEFIDTFKELSALKARTEDVAARLERIASGIENVLQRVTRLEERVEGLRSSVKAEILGDIMAQVAETRLLLELNQKGMLMVSRSGDGDALPMRTSPASEASASVSGESGPGIKRTDAS